MPDEKEVAHLRGLKGAVKGLDFRKFHPSCPAPSVVSNGAGWIFLLCLECRCAAELEASSEKLEVGAELAPKERAHDSSADGDHGRQHRRARRN